MKNGIIGLLFTLTFLLAGKGAAAQCAMCKAGVESEAGGKVSEKAAGLNHGILYLFVLPYGGIALLGTVWYLKHRKEKALN